MKETDLRPKYKLKLDGTYFVRTNQGDFSPIEFNEGILVFDSTQLAARRALIRANNERTRSKSTSAFADAWERDAVAMSIRRRR